MLDIQFSDPPDAPEQMARHYVDSTLQCLQAALHKEEPQDELLYAQVLATLSLTHMLMELSHILRPPRPPLPKYWTIEVPCEGCGAHVTRTGCEADPNGEYQMDWQCPICKAEQSMAITLLGSIYARPEEDSNG